MFAFSNVQPNYFVRNVESFCKNYLKDNLVLEAQLKSLCLMSFSRMKKSDSLFFSLDYTIRCASVALDFLEGLAIRRGYVDEEHLRLVFCTSLFAHVGIMRGIFPDDDNPSFVVSEHAKKEIPNSKTDSSLWRHYTQRSALFVRQNLTHQSGLQLDVVERAINNTDFTKRVDETGINDIGKITRACQIIALFSSEDFNANIVKIYLSSEEGDILNRFRLYTLENFRKGLKQYFWDYLFSGISETISVIQETDRGFGKIAKLYTRV